MKAGITIVCQVCGKEKYLYPSQIKNNKGTCSQVCKGFLVRGNKNPAWKGGEYTSKRGYVFTRNITSKSYTKRCRLVMERILGRPLKSSEFVHHINGCKNDDNPDNLMIMTNSQHSLIHIKAHHPMIGKHLSAESKSKISLAKTGKKLSPEHRENMRLARMRYLNKHENIH